MAQLTGEERRTQLLKAAVKVIAERGSGEARLADVAEEAGISAPLVLHYFGTREGLLVEALRYTEDCFYDVVFSRLDSAHTARQKLAELLLICCSPESVMNLPQGWALWFEVWSQAARNPQADLNRVELDSRWHSTLVDLVRMGQRSGEFLDDVNADLVAHMLNALLDGLSVQIALNDQTVSPSLALEIAGTCCMRVLGTSLDLQGGRPKA